MLSNFHTHTQFCDGRNTAEEMVLSAIEKGFDALGFSGHGYTDFDLTYCMKDLPGYFGELQRLREKYRDKIEIYIGVEEDAFHPADRTQYDYIIGSSHYLCSDGIYYPIDSNFEGFQECLAVFQGDVLAMAEQYYTAFCQYIAARKPDIIGHFDLITKYDEIGTSMFLHNEQYARLAESFIEKAAGSGCIFEVNTGAMARQLRSAPYPNENLLYILKRVGARLILSSDCHRKDALDYAFEDTKKYLRDIGFRSLMTIRKGGFAEYEI